MLAHGTPLAAARNAKNAPPDVPNRATGPAVLTVQLHITLGDRARLADTLYQQLVDAIRSGQLRQGDPLPPTRQLAAQLRVSRSTVTTAYDRLAGSG
jgi:hypothetical protein